MADFEMLEISGFMNYDWLHRYDLQSVYILHPHPPTRGFCLDLNSNLET